MRSQKSSGRADLFGPMAAGRRANTTQTAANSTGCCTDSSVSADSVIVTYLTELANGQCQRTLLVTDMCGIYRSNFGTFWNSFAFPLSLNNDMTGGLPGFRALRLV